MAEWQQDKTVAVCSNLFRIQLPTDSGTDITYINVLVTLLFPLEIVLTWGQ